MSAEVADKEVSQAVALIVETWDGFKRKQYPGSAKKSALEVLKQLDYSKRVLAYNLITNNSACVQSLQLFARRMLDVKIHIQGDLFQ